MTDNASVVLIGPMATGKTTVGTLLAHELGLPLRRLDELRHEYYAEICFDPEQANAYRARNDVEGFLSFMEPFDAYAVERLLSEPQHCVLDFGAGHSVFAQEALFARVAQALVPYPFVILLVPAPDREASVRVLNQRLRDRFATVPPGLMAMNERFVRQRSNYQLAKFVVYTEGRTPAETCREILSLVRREPGDRSRVTDLTSSAPAPENRPDARTAAH
jgi:hypothetical protein